MIRIPDLHYVLENVYGIMEAGRRMQGPAGAQAVPAAGFKENKERGYLVVMEREHDVPGFFFPSRKSPPTKTGYGAGIMSRRYAEYVCASHIREFGRSDTPNIIHRPRCDIPVRHQSYPPHPSSAYLSVYPYPLWKAPKVEHTSSDRHP